MPQGQPVLYSRGQKICERVQPRISLREGPQQMPRGAAYAPSDGVDPSAAWRTGPSLIQDFISRSRTGHPRFRSILAATSRSNVSPGA